MNIIGKKFGRLTVIKYIKKDRYNSKYFVVKCVCGNSRVICGSHLKSGHSKSCGCIVRETSRVNGLKRRTHGEGNGRTAEYRAWEGMKKRCCNTKRENYYLYGGRGITICQQWLNSYPTFLRDMGRRLSSAHSLDRINNNGNYSPSNCRWATSKEQANNRRPRVDRNHYSCN